MTGPPPRSALVTGGTGYLGSLTLAALADQGVEHVIAFDVRAPRAKHPAVTYELGDIRSANLGEIFRRYEVEAVVHLAAVMDPPPGMDAGTLHDIEVGGTERVLAGCLAAGVSHVTVASSGAAYGYQPANRGRWLTEDDPIPGSARFLYSRHKAEVEALLARYRDTHPDLRQLVLRPGTILGERTSNQITALFEKAFVLDLLGTDVPFVFVWDLDVAEVIARGVTQWETGVFNLAGDGVVTLAEIARIEGARRLTVPPGLLSAGLAVLRRLRLTRYGPEHVDFLRYRPVLASDRLKQAFPGLPRKTSQEAYDVYRRARRSRERSRG